LARPRLAPLIPPSFRDWLSELFAAAELVRIIEPIAACRDPTDAKFLELAINGHADLIISGDADLLALNPFDKSRSSRLPISYRASRVSRPRAPYLS